MGDGSLTPNFEACLLGLKKGDKKSFKLGLKMHSASLIE